MSLTAEALRDELAAELSRHRGAAPLRDDQAFLLLTEDPNSAARRSTPAGDFGIEEQPAAALTVPLV
jgi:hypothetical protein